MKIKDKWFAISTDCMGVTSWALEASAGAESASRFTPEKALGARCLALGCEASLTIFLHLCFPNGGVVIITSF